MSRQGKSDVRTETETPFLSLFVPQDEWFQDLLKQKAGQSSVSDYLVDLIVNDLFERKIITAKEFQEFKDYKKPKIRRTRFSTEKAKQHKVFALYMPKGLTWLRSKLTPEVLREKCESKNRSEYIWTLFVQAQAEKRKVTKAQLREFMGETAKAA